MRHRARHVVAHHALAELQRARDRVETAAFDRMHDEGRAGLARQFAQRLAHEAQLVDRERAAFRHGRVEPFLEQLVFRRVRAHAARAQAVDGEIGGDAEQVGAQKADLFGMFEAQQAHIGFLRDLLRFRRRIEPAGQKRDQRAVVLAEQAGDLRRMRFAAAAALASAFGFVLEIGRVQARFAVSCLYRDDYPRSD